MAPNHPSSKHYPSTRRLHGYFTYLGNGRFQLLPKTLEREPTIRDEILPEEEFEEAAISLEKDLETFIFGNISSVEKGLSSY